MEDLRKYKKHGLLFQLRNLQKEDLPAFQPSALLFRGMKLYCHPGRWLFLRLPEEYKSRFESGSIQLLRLYHLQNSGVQQVHLFQAGGVYYRSYNQLCNQNKLLEQCQQNRDSDPSCKKSDLSFFLNS